MATNYIRRKSSLPHFSASDVAIRRPSALDVLDEDLRWRRSSHAALCHRLPSHHAMTSDIGLTLSRKLNSSTRKSSVVKSRSVASVLRHGDPEVGTSSTTIRKLLQNLSVSDQWKLMDEDDHFQTTQHIKGMPATLSVKRKYRDQLLKDPDSKIEGFKYKQRQVWQKFRSQAKNVFYMLELWAGSFKIIEGHFGTATMSYFRFLRWMMFLNLYLSIIVLCLVLVPFLALQPQGVDSFADCSNPGLFKTTLSTFTSTLPTATSESTNSLSASPNRTSAATFFLEASKCSCEYDNYTHQYKETESVGQDVLDVLQGTGWMENTVLFYGRYHNRTFKAPIGGGNTYDMSLAYLMATGLAFILSFLLLVRNSAKRLKEGAMDSSGKLTQFSNKVFGAWDFCIANESAAKIKHKNLKHEFETDLENQRLQWKKENRSTGEKVKLVIIRLLVNLLVISILGGSLVLIYWTNEKLFELQKDTSMNDFVLLIIQYLPSITITLLNVMVPVIFTKVSFLEDYTPTFQINITLIRIVFIRLASLAVLMISLYKKILEGDAVDSKCGNKLWSVSNTSDSTTDVKCWETYVGQQVYKLVFMNFLVVVLVTFLWEFPRKILVTKFSNVKVFKLLGQQEFDLTKNVLDLVYLQTLCWLGVFFSPLIPAMCFVSCFVFFYVKKASLLTNCLPSQRYRTSRSNAMFMTVLLLSFAMATIPIVYMIGKWLLKAGGTLLAVALFFVSGSYLLYLWFDIKMLCHKSSPGQDDGSFEGVSFKPSQSCGPFRVYSGVDHVIFSVIPNVILLWPEKVQEVFFVLGTGSFLIIAAALMALLMYYYWAVAGGHSKMTELLREQLKVEGQDKQFLLARVNEIISKEEVTIPAGTS